MTGCCTETFPIPDWVQPGAEVVSRVSILTSMGTVIEPGCRGIICHVDEWSATVVGIEGQYPGLQVVQGGPDFLINWTLAP